MRPCRVTAFFLDLDAKIVGRRVDCTRVGDDDTRFVVSVDVAAEYHRHPFERARGDHRLRACAALFGGLKQNAYGCGQGVVLSEKLGGAQNHCRVPVMPAGMHDALMLRGEPEACLFQNRKCIDVGPQGHCWTAIASLNFGEDPRLGDTALVGDPEPVELSANTLGGLFFLKRELGMAVKLATEADQSLFELAID